MQDRGVPSKYWNVADLFVIMPAHDWINWKYVNLIQIHLRSIPCGMLTFKKLKRKCHFVKLPLQWQILKFLEITEAQVVNDLGTLFIKQVMLIIVVMQIFQNVCDLKTIYELMLAELFGILAVILKVRIQLHPNKSIWLK